MFVYQAKIVQYCFYHEPPKNSTVLHSPLPRQISTVYAQNRPQVETVLHCTYLSRVKSLQYIRRPPSYKPYQPLSSFPACLAKHPFLFLPEIRSLRQVANELYGHINSALAIYVFFMRSYIYIMRTSMVTCSGDMLLWSFLRHRTSRNGNPRHSLGGARTLMFFVLFCFCLFFSWSF